MKYFKIAGLCLVSVLVTGMALAGSAFAEPSWLVCLPGTGSIEYSTNQCTTPAANGGFVSVEAATTDAVRGLFFTLTLKDTGTALGTSEVQCWGGRSTGWVGPGNKATVLTADVEKPETSCKGLKVCESNKVKAVEGLDLPWKEELEAGTENMAQTKVEGTGGGAGWKITCTIGIVGEETDDCIASLGAAEELSFGGELSETTFLIFLQRTSWLMRRSSSCTLGNSTSGHVAGQGSLELTSGNGLAINLL